MCSDILKLHDILFILCALSLLVLVSIDIMTCVYCIINMHSIRSRNIYREQMLGQAGTGVRDLYIYITCILPTCANLQLI